MKNQLWAAIHDIFQEMHTLRQHSRGVVSVKKAGSIQVLKRGVQQDEVVTLRSEIRTKLDFLKATLAENLNEREIYLVLFPIVIYFDEMVQSDILTDKKIEWPPLQQELYKTNKGGEIFYEALEDILRKPETLPFIYEVFYFCLNDGFTGKYSGNPVKIKEYKDKLKSKIPITKIDSQDIPEKGPNLMRPIRFPFHYYLCVVILLVGVYISIQFFDKV